MTDDEKNIAELIGQQIKIARRKRRITQTEAGAALGVSFQQFQKYENGKTRISASDLLRLSLFFDKHLDFFFRDARAKLTNKPLISSFANNEAARIEEQTIYKYGLLISGIADEPFRAQLLRLAKRHNKLVATCSCGDASRHQS